MSFYSWSESADKPPRFEMHDAQGRVIAEIIKGPDAKWHWKRNLPPDQNSEGNCPTLREAQQQVPGREHSQNSEPAPQLASLLRLTILP